MNITVFIVSLFLLQIICFFVGKKASQQISSQEDYFLAGKALRFFPLLMTLIATQIGGGLILGSAEEAFRYGWVVLLYPMGACLGLLVLASGVGRKMAQFNVSTVASLFEVVYGSKKLKKIASLLSIISLFMILIGQVIASKKFMASLNFDSNFIFFAFWGIVILYTVMGGLKAVVATDIIQALFFIAVFILCVVYTLVFDSFSLTSANFAGNFEFDSAKFTGWLLMPLLFMVIEQDMAQRMFAAKSGKVVSLATGFAAIAILLIAAIPVFYGVLGNAMGFKPLTGASIFMQVVQLTSSPILMALVATAIIAAIISTADSLMNAISSNIAQDFNFKGLDVKRSQWITLAIGVLALAGSFYFNSIVGILIQSYELSVSCLFVPVFAALFIKKGNQQSALYSILFGALAFFFLRVDFMPKEILSLLVSFTGFAIGEIQHYFSLKSVKFSR
jgi:SSS family solute:Na+ symporter